LQYHQLLNDNGAPHQRNNKGEYDMDPITVTFPGGTQVCAKSGGFAIPTDQPVEDGGTNTSPSPYDLFLSSIATCAGFYVARFCQERDLPTAEMTMTLDIERNEELRQLEKVKIAIQLPEGFPEKYKKAVLRAADMCSVKKAIMNPPEFEMVTE
jgi:putative redox protein